uniref:Si:ch211-207n2.7 n=1 Tax=Cynoglossus semilaevis TaxID=244447 RepID=A0A3P8UZQ7_CYNSE
RTDRWRSGWCSTTSPLVHVLCLVLTVVYVLLDKLRNFVAGIFIPQYHCPYVVALSFAQVLVSLLVLNLLHLLGLVPLKPVSCSLAEKLLVPSICGSVLTVLSLWAQANGSSSGLFSVTLPLLPLLTAAFSFILKLSTPPSAHVCVLVSMLSGTCLVAAVSSGVSVVEPLENLYAPLASLLHCLSLNWLLKVSEAERLHHSDDSTSVFHLFHAQLVVQMWVLGLLWLLHPDGPGEVLSQGSWNSLLFHGYLLALLLLGMLLNFLVFATALCVSPLSAAMLLSAEQVLKMLVSVL